jgi:hypothetical protein
MATNYIRQFPLHFPSCVSPCVITFQLDSNAGYAMFRGSVKSTGYPLHSPVSPSLPLPCVTECHHISTGLFLYPCAAVICITYIKFPKTACCLNSVFVFHEILRINSICSHAQNLLNGLINGGTLCSLRGVN